MHMHVQTTLSYMSFGLEGFMMMIPTMRTVWMMCPYRLHVRILRQSSLSTRLLLLYGTEVSKSRRDEVCVENKKRVREIIEFRRDSVSGTK